MNAMITTASTKPSPSPPPRHHPPTFTPIQECERELENDDEVAHQHPPTPLPPPRRPETASVSCNKCRPSSRDKITIVPLDTHSRSSASSPNGIFKSLITSLTSKKSPAAAAGTAEERWRAAAEELSRKLNSATRKRDEAVLEASRLKHSMAELESKLDKLESYCHELKTGLDNCANNPRLTNPRIPNANSNKQDKVIEYFLASVSEARTSLRILSRALTLQLRQAGPKVYDRLLLLLSPYDVKISLSKNPRALVFHLEALLNRAFFEDFENVGFSKSAPNSTLNPIERCEQNFKSFCYLKGLSWEEVLSKGTKHFSEEFSKFCDRKMSEVVSMLGWNRAWPEPLLQAFFNGSKSMWLVHLLANSVHPGLAVFRVDKGVKFDTIYMEDVSEAKAQKLVPDQVRIMIAPGFYVGNNVVKCKVLCRYHSGFSDKGLTPSPV